SATSCEPNPCEPTQPTTVCCLPGSAEGAFVRDDDGGDGEHHNQPECVRHESADACTAAGGTVVTAISCHPNPCTVPPPPPHACCFPGSADGAFIGDRGGSRSEECRMLPPPACVGQGGRVSGPSCASHPCSRHGGGDDGDGQGDDSQGNENGQGDNSQGDG